VLICLACGLTAGERGIGALHADAAGEIGLHVELRLIRIFCFDEPETDPYFSIGAHTRITGRDLVWVCP
jgi:hypothetical protein